MKADENRISNKEYGNPHAQRLRTGRLKAMFNFDRTDSLCPVCLRRLPATRQEEGDRIFLIKDCPDHGRFKTLIWEGSPAFASWKRPKIPATPSVCYRPVDRGCPFDCGLCPDHRQRSCTILLEVTSRCNLSCSFCYADSKGQPASDPDPETIKKWYASAARAGARVPYPALRRRAHFARRSAGDRGHGA